MTHPPAVHRVVAGLARSEIAGVNPHTLEIALARAENDQVPFEQLGERQIAIALLERIGYPATVAEFSLFLNLDHTLSPGVLSAGEISSEHALHYVRWSAAFLNDPEPNIQKNVRILLRWLVTHWRDVIAADPSSLDPLRQVADDSETGWRSSGFLVYALGNCGTLDDYDRVIRHAERVIEHDYEQLDLVADGLHQLYPPALISALQFFLEHTHPGENPRQFNTGVHLLARVADIEDRAFWRTYHADIESIVDRLEQQADRHKAIERIIDVIEKHLALAALDGE